MPTQDVLSATPPGRPAEPRRRRLPWFLLALHWIIIVNFAVNIAYGSFQVFFTLRPKGISGPLWDAALQIPHELMVTRRLYAIEVWISIGALAIYLALTEYLPRLLNRRS